MWVNRKRVIKWIVIGVISFAASFLIVHHGEEISLWADVASRFVFFALMTIGVISLEGERKEENYIMDEKIYAVFSGSYSDTRIEGYFEDPDEAYTYCFYMNEKNGYHDYHVEEAFQINMKYSERPRFHYEFGFRFFDDGKALLSHVDTLRGGMCPNAEVNKHLTFSRNEVYDILVYLSSYDENKAWEIAYDALAQYKAEKDGV